MQIDVKGTGYPLLVYVSRGLKTKHLKTQI
jgi:hypothetical protein